MVILVYHYFSTAETNWLTCSVTDLGRHLSYLRDFCHVVPLLEGLEKIERGEKLPQRTVALTVDDTDSSFYDLAWPVFRKYGIPICCNVITGLLGQKLSMGRECIQVIGPREIEKLIVTGLVVLGSHSATHAKLNTLDSEQLAKELVDSKRAIEAIQGHCKVFCYPYGNTSVITADSERLLLETGYRYALTTCSGVVSRGTDRLRIGRTNIAGLATIWHFPFFCNGVVSRLIRLKKRALGERWYRPVPPGGKIGFEDPSSANVKH
jgi:peptidoglycan/xylan/chitin deacetylase (PgdA/CDA1 family)